MDNPSTQEKQYQKLLDYQKERGLESMGLMSSQAWYDDPKRLAFMTSRYKFVSKMLSGKKHAVEVGCGDGFGTRIVAQEVDSVTAFDFDPLFIEDAKQRVTDRWQITFKVHDITQSPVPGPFDGVYALDVLEHVEQAEEDVFIQNIIHNLDKSGVVILGMPSLESQDYASEISKEGHVNCKSMPDFKSLMEKYFYNVFMFAMNDEVVHTGYHKMAHYIFAVCCNRR